MFRGYLISANKNLKVDPELRIYITVYLIVENRSTQEKDNDRTVGERGQTSVYYNNNNHF